MRPVTQFLAGVLVGVVASETYAEHRLPRSAPEAQGISSAALLDLINTLDNQIEGLHSVMIVRHGHVIAEGWWKPYAAKYNHQLYSLSKSFTSTAVGFLVAEGRLSVDDVVADFFPADTPSEVPANLKQMRVRELLAMVTGHQEVPSAAADIVSAKSFLAQPIPHLPGTHFQYNTAATFMQSAIVQQVSGKTLLDYLRPRLFEPLGIEHPVWDTNFEGISLGGYGLRVRTEDIAKFGQLYLQQGSWNGKRLLPVEWISMATAKQTSNGSNPSNDWHQGYGFQFWRCRHNAYRGDGAFGQFCIVMPDQDSVVAITSGVRDMQGVLNVVWDKLLPACKAKELSANHAAHQRLREKMARLEIAPVPGAASSSVAMEVWNRRFVFPKNDQLVESLVLTPTEDELGFSLRIVRDGESLILPAGFGSWIEGQARLPVGKLARLPSEPIASSGGWVADHTLVVKTCAYETPFHLTLTLAFEDDTVRLASEVNVGFGPQDRETLLGRADEGKPPVANPTAFSAAGNRRDVIRLYPGDAPGSEDWTQAEKEIPTTIFGGPVVSNVVHPTLTVVRPDATVSKGTAVVICPGGGFFFLSIDHEGMDVAQALSKKGVTSFVLRYRLVETKTNDPSRELMSRGNIGPIVKPIVPLATADGRAAIQYVRTHAADYGIDPERIGIMGFSAGGTVACSVGYTYSTDTRPDFVAPIYLAYDWAIKDGGVPKNAPPMFIVAATDDPLDLAAQSVNLYRDWTAAHRSAELHLYARGGHGFGMKKQSLPSDGWIDRFTDWLADQGMLPHPKK